MIAIGLTIEISKSARRLQVLSGATMLAFGAVASRHW